MKKLKNSMVTLCMTSLVLSLVWSIPAFAATTPSLGAAASYGILGSTYTNTSAGTTVNGDIGFTTGPAVAPGGTQTNYGPGAPYATAGTDQGTALTALASQSCTFTFAGGAINLSTDTTHGAIGVYTPGVYCSSGAMDIGGQLTLNGSGTYIFRAVGALTSTAGAVVTLSGASACDVFWTPTAATTLAANTTFAGTIIGNAGITVGANTTWTGRSLAAGGTVTTDTDTITVPTCTVAPAFTPAPASTATLHVIKQVVNNNGGIATAALFNLHVKLSGTDVAGSPAIGAGTLGTSYSLAAGTYIVSEDVNSSYAANFSGDCNSSGSVTLLAGDDKTCTITNDDIALGVVPPVPPLVDLVKVPSPLALPDGPGLVKYTYTLKNIGTVPVTDITMVDDTCSPTNLVSGDLNDDDQLDLTEVWIYNCSATISETHTNTAIVTGWANGISATDVASATVAVGLEAVPPLIHLTKVPNPLTLLVGGGVVTYNEKITNPGTVALSNISLSDDKCSPMKYIFGDIDKDSKLDITESWTYTCKTNLTETTTNTAVATGEANGIKVRDFAVATVVVATAVPGLPDTGFAPTSASTWLAIMASGIVAAALLFLYIIPKKQTK